MIVIPFIDSLINKLRPQLYDDVYDRLNYFVTPLLFLFFSIAVSAKQYVGSPIQCWCPAQFKGGWEQYTEDYCFVQNTYHLPFDKPIPHDQQQREEGEIGYYQWVPIMLAVQAFFFYMPNFIWKALCWQTGICNMKTILKAAVDCSRLKRAERAEEIKALAQLVEDGLDMGVGDSWLGRLRRLNGNAVSCLYLLVKLLYVVNIVCQFLLLDAFLSSTYSFWGFQIFNDLVHGREWQQTGHFPRVTLCDFDVRVLGNVHHYTVQCVLMINMFNEKIYLFIWFWLVLVGVLTLGNLVQWLVSSLPTASRARLLRQKLRSARDLTDRADRRLLSRFASHSLHGDGILLLSFIEGHAGGIVANELSEQLWCNWLERGQEALLGARRSPADSHTTKSTNPDDHNGFSEHLFDAKKPLVGLDHPLLPSAPNNYPGPPPPPPKPALAV